MSETFLVATIIEKLSLSWKDFKNYMKNKQKEMGLEDLIVRLRIKEDNGIFDKKSRKFPIESKENLVEHKTGQRYKASFKKSMENASCATNKASKLRIVVPKDMTSKIKYIWLKRRS